MYKAHPNNLDKDYKVWREHQQETAQELTAEETASPQDSKDRNSPITVHHDTNGDL